jgi:DNA-binding NarL/FixJ family response regulator
MVDVCIMAPSGERRERILSALSGARAIRVAGSAAGFPFLRSLIAQTPADLAVIDWEAQTESATLREWLFEFLDLMPVVVLCSAPDPAVFSRILRARAGAMILQTDISAEQIVQTIQSVASGLLVFDSALMPQRSDYDPLTEPLTPREG